MRTRTGPTTPPGTHRAPARRRSHRARTAVVLSAMALAVAAVPLAAVAAEAAEPQATSSAQALRTAVVGLGITSGLAGASSDGRTTSDSGVLQAGIGGGGTGAAAQHARATKDGSAACAAVLGSGGTLQVNDDGTCTTSLGTGDVVIPLTNLITLRASSIVARCSVASPGGAAKAEVELANAFLDTRVKLGLATVPGPSLALVATGPRTTLSIPAVLSVVLNDTSTTQGTSSTPGSASAAALIIKIAGLADVVVASVACGVPTVLLPAVPLRGAPLAVGVLGAAALATRRWWLPAARQLAGASGAAS